MRLQNLDFDLFFDSCLMGLPPWCAAAAGIPVGREEDRQLAWRRVFEFFKKHLG
jgi:hypothetical protein